jgi:hypothetical protein
MERSRKAAPAKRFASLTDKIVALIRRVPERQSEASQKLDRICCYFSGSLVV